MVYEGHCSSAFVLRIDHVPVLLIDVGFGVVRQCRAFVQSIPKYIYVTHNHGDHAAELPICVAIEKHVTVVAQEDVAELLQTHRMSEMVGAPLDVTWLKCQTKVRTTVTGELSISVHRARHSQLCYGCVVYYRGQAVLAVSGDSGYDPSLYHVIGQARTVFIDAREKSSDDHASYDEIKQFIAEHWSARQDSVWIYHHDEHETTHVTGLQLALPGQSFVLYSDE